MGEYMVENGLYCIKESFFELIRNLGGEWSDKDASQRPCFCCIKDKYIEGLYWAIPTSDLSHRTDKQKKKYQQYIDLPKRDMREAYYSIWKTTKPALYKISSCIPITDKYIDHPYVFDGKHVVKVNKDKIGEINRKLRRILSYENRKNNALPQHITDIKNYLVCELNESQSTEQIVSTIENKNDI